MKYSPLQRQITRKIHDLERIMRYHRETYIETEIKKEALIALLGGKYKGGDA